MATKIRLARGGSKKRPFYRVVVADTRAPRDGRFIEKLGTYNPLLADNDNNRVTWDKERVEHWLKQGAVPSERVLVFLNKEKIGQDLKVIKELNKKRAAKIELKRAEIEARKKAEAEAKAKEEAEKKAAEEAAKAEEEAAKAAEAEQAEAAPAEEKPEYEAKSA